MSFSESSSIDSPIQSVSSSPLRSNSFEELFAIGLSTSEVFGLSAISNNYNTSSSEHQNSSQNLSLSMTSNGNSAHSTSAEASVDTSILNDSISNMSAEMERSTSMLNDSISNMSAEIERVRRFCENVEINLPSYNLGSASTPRIVRANRPRIITADPVEYIDLSDLEYSVPRSHARNRIPDAVIDLCTPDGLHRETQPRARSARANTLRRRLEDPEIVVGASTPSPPKQICERTNNNSLEDNSYKCPVCLDPVGQRHPTSTKCGHVFCKICIESAIRTTHKCPICNNKLNARQTFRIYL